MKLSRDFPPSSNFIYNLTMTTSEIFVRLHEFDSQRLVVGPVLTKNLGKGKQTIKYVYSEVFYKNDNNELCKLFFEAPTQEVWGLNEVYPYSLAEEEKDPLKNLKGFQVAYPLTSENTVKNPTSDEEYIKSVFDSIFNATVEALKRECNKKKAERKVPQITYSAFTTAKSDGDVNQAVKKLYDHPNFKDSKDKNTNKPMRTFVKLLTKGLGVNLSCDTKIFGPNDEPLSARSLTVKGQKGKITPVFGLEGLYWGQHGNDSPYGVSARLFLDQCNYTPLGNTRGSSRRFLPSNNDEDNSFASPTGEADFEENSVPFQDEETNDLDLEEKEESPERDIEEKKPKAKKPRRKQIKKK